MLLHNQIMLSAILILLVGISDAEITGNGCCDPQNCDCDRVVDTIQEFNPLYAPITFGTSYLDYTMLHGQGSGAGVDGWFNTTTANPYYMLSNEIFALSMTIECYEFIADAILTFSSQLLEGTITSPLGINQDPMYGSGVFGVVDEQNGWQFKFLLTNTRVFAVLSHQEVGTGSPTNNFYSFTYAIPVSCRRPKDINRYRLILKPQSQTVWFMMDQNNVLRVSHPGRPPISEKFQIGQNGGDTYQSGFPSLIQIAFGFEVQSFGRPHGVCQEAIFDHSKDCIYKAECVCCKYAPWQNPVEYLIGLKMKYFELNVIQTYCEPAECPGPCCGGCCRSSDELSGCVMEFSSTSSNKVTSSSAACSSSSSSSPNNNCVEANHCVPRFDPQEPHMPIATPSIDIQNLGNAIWLGNHARAARRPARRPGQGAPGRVVGRAYSC